MSLDGHGIRACLGVDEWSVPRPFGPDGWFYLGTVSNPGSIIVSCFDKDGVDWVHASIARPEMPTYEDLKLLHAAVFPGGWAYQVFAPPSSHVNIHENALHIWGRLDGMTVLPDFAAGYGSI